MRISINLLERNGSAAKTCKAMAAGIKRNGDEAVLRSDSDYNMQGFDACVLWGFVTSCQNVIKHAVASGIPFVFLDMGYWRRDKGYYKVSVNDRHPMRYFMSLGQTPGRFNSLGIPLKPRQSGGDAILLAGMSGKAAWSWGLGPEAYERETIGRIRKYSKRRIIYRPKPSWSEARPIPGTIFEKNAPLEEVLKQTHCVVAHHSNVGCDALVAGIPSITKIGAASVLGPYDLATIEHPRFPTDDERLKWAANLAYCQWSIDEMSSGACWGFLKSAGLLARAK